MKKQVILLLISIFYLFSCSASPHSDALSQKNDFGGIVECPVHSIDYHAFDDALIQYVGSDAFDEWLHIQEEKGSNDDCLFGYGFPDFIKDFQISEDTYYSLFEDTISYYMYDHPTELLFHGTEDEIEAYYRDLENNRLRLAKKQCIFELKEALVRNSGNKIDNLRDVSIEELYLASSLSENELADIIKSINAPKQYVQIAEDLIFTAKSENDMFIEIPASARQPKLATEDPETDFEMVVEPVS